MDDRQLEKILLYILLGLVGVTYLYTVAPTLSFWDCGEFISSAYTLAIPHPPGTPLYVILGRVWLMIWAVIAAILPISKETAWHMNLLGLGLSVGTVFLIYRLLLKLFRLWKENFDQKTLIIVAFATSLAIAFFYTFWENAVETEVYAASTFVFVLINYIALLWYDTVKKGKPNNNYLLLSFYIIFLSTGIHLIPFLIFIPFYVFIFIVERRYLNDPILWLLGIFQVLFFGLTFILPDGLHILTIIVLILILLAGVLLPLNNPSKYKNWRFFWLGILLVILGISSELYLPIRSAKLTELYKNKKVNEEYLKGKNIAPRINECNPGQSFNSFNDVLHRKQYGPPRLIPRQTQDATGFNLIEGYFWQFALFIRYLSWQVMPETVNRTFRGLILAIFYLLGIWGMVELYKLDRKIFLFTILIMFMLSFAIVGYLNLKFSPSDSNPHHQPREVRERDYFFHTSDTYFGILMGLGFLGFLDWLKKETRKNRLARAGGLSGIVVFSIIPFFANFNLCNRYKNFVPKDYGYNMLISCDDGAIVFTNGDNDTFPLWFVQEVLGIKRKVTVANLSLINTNWYIKQLKYWGVPISFSDYVIDRLYPFVTPEHKVVYVKDIMIRNILATNAGIKLKNEDYLISQKEFAQKYLKGYKGKRPIYFASTVSPENYQGFRPYLRLEGLVYRVVGDSGNPDLNVDIEKTKNFFYKTYRYTGIFGPEKQKVLARIIRDFEKRKAEGEFLDFSVIKDENTRRLYTNYAAGLFQLGLALQQRMDIQNTLNAWKFARLFEPQPSYYFDYNLGVLYAQLGKRDSADYYLSQITVKNAELMTKIGSVYMSMRELEKSVEYFQRALGINPRYPQAYFGLITTYLAMADTNSARDAIQNWLRLNPNDTTAQNMLKRLEKR